MKLIEHFFRLLAPSICLRCGQEGSLLCVWCREESLIEAESRCYRCHALSPNNKTCAACRRHSPIAHLWIRTDYTDTARELVHATKFKYSTEAAGLIADELMNTIPALPPDTLVVHAPTITSHVRERGFDHAKAVAVEVARQSNLRTAAVLARRGQKRQVGSSRRQRLEQLDGAFRVQRPYLLADSPVLLVDDVLTTGGTLEAAANALKAVGVKKIDAVVFAQAK